MTEKHKAALTLTELGRQPVDAPIWVMNQTKGDRRGVVQFSIGGGGTGREVTVAVAATFAPTCLTDQVARVRLLDSADFKLAVNRGMLKLIYEEEADEMLSDESTRIEYDKVRSTSVNAITQDALNGLGSSDPNAIGDAVNVNGANTSSISNPVSQFLAVMDTMTDDESLVTVKNMGVLTMVEYSTIQKRASELNYEKTGKYVYNAKRAG